MATADDLDEHVAGSPSIEILLAVAHRVGPFERATLASIVSPEIVDGLLEAGVLSSLEDGLLRVDDDRAQSVHQRRVGPHDAAVLEFLAAAREVPDAGAAFRAALLTENPDILSAVIVENYRDLLTLDVFELIRPVEKLPKRYLATRPYLSLFVALAYNTLTTYRRKALEYFALAAVAASAHAAVAKGQDRAVALTVWSGAQRSLGQGAAAARTARDALHALRSGRHSRITLNDPARSTLVRHNATSILANGDVIEAMETFEDALALAAPATRQERLVLSLIAGVSASAGERRAVEMALTALDRLEDVSDGGAGPYVTFGATCARAYLALERHDLKGAVLALDSASAEAVTNELWPIHAIASSWCSILDGDFRLGLARLDEVSHRKDRPRITRYWASRLSAQYRLLQVCDGRPQAALVRHTDHPRARAHHTLVSALAEHTLGRDARAVALLTADSRFPHVTVETRLARDLLLCAVHPAHPVSPTLLSTKESGAFVLWGGALASEDRTLILDLMSEAGHPDGPLHDLLRRVERGPERPPSTHTLTPREMDVLRALAEGYSVPEVAGRLHVSSNTVKAQVRAVYAKLQVNRRADAILVAREQGLL